MLNQVVLVGRIVKTPELRITENGKKTSRMTLAVPRNYGRWIWYRFFRLNFMD